MRRHPHGLGYATEYPYGVGQAASPLPGPQEWTSPQKQRFFSLPPAQREVVKAANLAMHKAVKDLLAQGIAPRWILQTANRFVATERGSTTEPPVYTAWDSEAPSDVSPDPGSYVWNGTAWAPHQHAATGAAAALAEPYPAGIDAAYLLSIVSGFGPTISRWTAHAPPTTGMFGFEPRQWRDDLPTIRDYMTRMVMFVGPRIDLLTRGASQSATHAAWQMNNDLARRPPTTTNFYNEVKHAEAVAWQIQRIYTEALAAATQ